MSDRANRKSAGQPSVSTHPAFPVIVALWFAALLGIGSIVLPLAMFENIAVASGLAKAYQAVQPPFGATTRIAVAVAAAAIGAIAGLLIARRVAAANAAGPLTRRAAALRPLAEPAGLFAKRPISAHEELGEGGIDAEDEAVTPRESFSARRRALAVADESARSEFLSFAPLPGQSPNTGEPLDLLAFDDPEAIALEQEAAIAEPAPKLEPVVPADDPAFGSPALSAPPPPSPFAEFAAPVDEPASFTRKVEPETGSPIAHRPLDELGVVELVERFAIALQRHREMADEVPAETPTAREAPVPFTRAADTQPDDFHDFAAPAALERAQSQTIPAALRPFGFDDVFAEDDDTDSLPDFDLTAALAHNRVPFAAPAIEAESPAEVAEPQQDDALDEESEEVAEAEYTSLLAMKSPFGLSREPVRFEDFDDEEAGDEPVTVFPGHAARRAAPAPDGPARDAVTSFARGDSLRLSDAPSARVEQAATPDHKAFIKPAGPRLGDSGETERALRDALEKLQKLSGAA